MNTQKKMINQTVIAIVVLGAGLLCSNANATAPPPCPPCWTSWPDCDVWKCLGQDCCDDECCDGVCCDDECCESGVCCDNTECCPSSEYCCDGGDCVLDKWNDWEPLPSFQVYGDIQAKINGIFTWLTPDISIDYDADGNKRTGDCCVVMMVLLLRTGRKKPRQL